MKRFLSVLVFFVLGLCVYVMGDALADAIHLKSIDKYWHGPSIFTEELLLNRQQVYAGQTVRVLYNHKPVLPGHVLIIPKRAVERVEELTDEEWIEMRHVIEMLHLAFREVYLADDYVLLVQNGVFGGQTVPHMHFHMIPRDRQNIVMAKFRLWGSLFSNLVGLTSSLSDEKLNQKILELQNYLK